MRDEVMGGRANVIGPDRIEREGFAVVEGVLGPETIALLIAAVEPMARDTAALRRGGELYGLRDVLRRVPLVRSVAGSRGVRELVEPVLGPAAFPVRALWFDKTPTTNWSVPWHRDLTIAVRERKDIAGYGPWTVKAGLPHVQPPLSVLERMLTVRLHLDDCGADQGPLCVVPGSHRLAALDARADCAARPTGAATPCLVGRGGAVVMRPLLLHASPSSRAAGHRRVVHLEFAAGPLPGGLEWSEAISA